MTSLEILMNLEEHDAFKVGGSMHKLMTDFWKLSRILLTNGCIYKWSSDYIGVAKLELDKFKDKHSTFYAYQLSRCLEDEINRKKEQGFDADMDNEFKKDGSMSELFGGFWRLNKSLFTYGFHFNWSDKYWAYVVAETRDLYEKHRTPFAYELVRYLTDELERVSYESLAEQLRVYHN